MNTKQFKKLLITLIGIFAIALSAILILNIINKPDIKNIQFSNIDRVKNNSSDSSEVEMSDIKQTDFSYTIIGYRYGEESSSIIVKKGSKEFVVYEGDLLENTYELMSISPDEIIFKGSGKLYKLENKFGK